MLKYLVTKILKKKKNSLDKIFYPKSIAIIGASNDINKIGGYIFSQISKLKNIKSYPINVKSNFVQGFKSYPNIRAVNKNIDLAIIVIPSIFVIDALKDCIFTNIKNIIIISAGFKEVSLEGKKREEEIKRLVKKNNLNLIGPNCLGILNSQINLNCSFAMDIPKFGGTALISQSGAVIDGIIDWSFKYNIGFSKIVSLGNMAGVDELEILKYLGDDSKTKSIVFYMETLEKGYKFGKVLREVSKKKPVIIIKPGKSKNAQKAIGSHTGSLAQDNILVETLIKDNNGIFVNSLNELFGILIALNSNFNKGKNLVILTNAGGPGVIATDKLAETNFKLYQFSEKEKKKFYSFLPKEASINNPIDILGDAKSDRYKNTLNILIQNPNIENILILLTPQIMTDSKNIAKDIIEISKPSQNFKFSEGLGIVSKKNSLKTNKNIFSCFIGEKEIESAIKLLGKNKFANFLTPSDSLISQNYLLDYKNFDYNDEKIKFEIEQKKIEDINDKLFFKKGLLDYKLTKEVLNILNISIPNKIIIENKSQISIDLILRNKKYILKVDSPDLIHKKDFGGVVLDVNFENFEEKANELFLKITKITKNFTITVEEEVEGTEVIIGLKSDEDLGNFIMFGMGGSYVNIIEDINFSTCPLNYNSAKKLVEKSKVFKILKGFRGSKSINFKHLYELLIRMSYLQYIFPQIKEVDLNPIICNESNIFLVDVKLIL